MNDYTVTIAGGGSTYTPGIVLALLNRIEKFNVKTIRLYDNDFERNEDMFLILQHILKMENKTDIEIMHTTDPKTAFEGTDFIFSQIRVGGLAMREQDEKIPLRHGLVGQETCGLGGFAYGLRTIGGILEMIEYILKYAPEAWILNYTNPETLVSEAIRRSYPEIKMINVCDMTISLEETICQNYGYDRTGWIPTYYGLNHFGWYTKIYDRTLKRDVMPEIIQRLREEKMQAADFNKGDTAWEDTFKNVSKLVEFFPNHLPNNYLEYYFFPDEMVASSNPEYTRANMVMDGREANRRRLASALRHGDAIDELGFNFGEHGQYIVDIAVSILNNENKRFLVIVPNRGSIPNLRDDAVVEVPAYIGATGAEPIALDAINDQHKGMMEAQVAAEKLLVDAFFEKSYQKALEAFTLNQTVPNATVAKEVLDEMIQANSGYWPELV